MELTKNDTKITSKEAEQNLKKSSIEWVEKELSTGIELPAHYWKNGNYKQLFSMMMYKSVIVPFLVIMTFILSILIEDTKATLITGGILAGYVVLGILIHKKTEVRFVLSQESITVISGRKTTVIPWKNIKNITHFSSTVITGVKQYGVACKATNGVSYEIIIQTDKKYYRFYEVYTFPHDMLFDNRGKIILPILPLHILCVLMQTAREKVKKTEN